MFTLTSVLQVLDVEVGGEEVEGEEDSEVGVEEEDSRVREVVVVV